MRQAPGSGELNRLESNTELAKDTYVSVNGPWDSFGLVRTSTKQDDGTYRNLVRGIPERLGERPAVAL